MTTQDRLSSAFAALADPTRRDILYRLRGGPLTVSELATHYPMSRPAISQHLAVLEKAGLVERNRRAQWSECSLAPNSLAEVAAWVEQQHTAWNERFDRLEEYLTKEKPDE
ncbi:metalloregulator ArsR/SmtB family transcription factor [Yaniella flava]|uniref:Metalloregulator ArsR/SmtB family transcription factor n=1 Tax=Yaniella flava TaxID=287930 RepID=A0ABP5FMF3_9MICC|nr:winged helix-turn-helix transcriptional regulator [Micrococcaceae bacterium]